MQIFTSSDCIGNNQCGFLWGGECNKSRDCDKKVWTQSANGTYRRKCVTGSDAFVVVHHLFLVNKSLSVFFCAVIQWFLCVNNCLLRNPVLAQLIKFSIEVSLLINWVSDNLVNNVITDTYYMGLFWTKYRGPWEGWL